MPSRPDPRTLLRWMFLALGVLVIFGHDFVVYSVLRVPFWGGLFFGESSALFAFSMALAYSSLIPEGLLCLATSWGLKRGYRWSRYTGIVVSCMFLPQFPWFTIAGAIGLYALYHAPARLGPLPKPAPKRTKDYWASKQASVAQHIVSFVCLVAAFAIPLDRYGQRLRLPAYDPGLSWFLYLVAFLWLNTASHELGHAAAAWALHFRFKVISIGPLTFWNDGYGYQFRFEWSRVIESSGYMGAVPVSDQGLRWKQIAVTAGGPAASLLSGLALASVTLALPGTRLEGYWWFVAFNALLGLAYAFISMIPIGYSDGTMLMHLILGTRAGAQLLERVKMTRTMEEAEALHKRTLFVEEVALREQALASMLEGGESNALATAACRMYLGHALLSVEDWPRAEREFRKTLESEAETALDPALAANASSFLHKTCVERFNVAETARTYVAALKILSGRTKGRNRTGLAVSRAMLAELHARAGRFAEALEETTQALSILPNDRDRLFLRVLLLTTGAQCRVHLGQIDSGMASVSRALEIVRSGSIPRASQNLAWEDIACAGKRLWYAGQSQPAIDLFREAIPHLESGGAAATAALNRIKLAAALRQLGSLEDAFDSLPMWGRHSVPAQAEGVLHAPVLRRPLLEERARIHLAAARPQAAADDARELVSLWEAAPEAPAPELAVARSLLAQAILDSGDDYTQAEEFARPAVDVLRPRQHPEAAACLITLAVAQFQSIGVWAVEPIEQALSSIQSHPLLTPAAKARLIESQKARLARYQQVLAPVAASR